jgi:ParB/RepB/Spo0J family partition protein
MSAPSPRTKMIKLASIKVSPDRMRKLRPEKVDEIAESIKERGQLQPILVRQHRALIAGRHLGKGAYHLVFGLHRLEARRKLGFKEVECRVSVMSDDQARLAEIDENLIRADLSPAETAAHHAERKRIYEKMHPETAKGAAPANKKKGGKGGKLKAQNEPSTPAYTKDAAKKTGKSKATIKRAVARGKAIDTQALDDVKGTCLDTGIELDALAKLPVSEQRKLAARAKAGETVTAVPAVAKPKPVASATDPLWTGARRSLDVSIRNFLSGFREADAKDKSERLQVLAGTLAQYLTREDVNALVVAMQKASEPIRGVMARVRSADDATRDAECTEAEQPALSDDTPAGAEERQTFAANAVPAELPEGYVLVHARHDRVPCIIEGNCGRSGDGAADVRMWMEKWDPKKHVRCKCSVPTTRSIATCELTGNIDFMEYHHFIPRAKRKSEDDGVDDLIDAYRDKFPQFHGGLLTPDILAEMREALKTGVETPALVEQRLVMERNMAEYDAKLAAEHAQPFTLKLEKHYTKRIKKRRLREGDCERPWQNYFDFRDAHPDQVEALTVTDIAYVGQWTSCRADGEAVH